MKHLLYILFIFFYAQTFAQQEKYSRVRITLNNSDNLEKLHQLGIEIDHGIHQPDQYFISEFSASELKKIKDSNFDYTILIDDVVANFLKLSKNPIPENKDRSVDNSCFSKYDYQTPQNFKLGSMGGYFTFKEMTSNLDLMMKLYPNLISEKEEIGKSIEGVSIFSYKISTSTDPSKPKVLYNALTHTREPASLSQLLFFMWYLLENYDNDFAIKKIIDNTQLYFVPCVNPDGYIFNEKTNPSGGGMWRKNRRKINSNYGIDLNRNFGYKWGLDENGSSSNPSYDDYRGAYAFSEPETDALRKFCEKHNFKFALNYHTFGNKLNTPWGFNENEKLTDKLKYEEFSKILTQENNFKYGTTFENLNYVVNGSANDWLYGDTIKKEKCFSFTPEIGSEYYGFWPSSNYILEICKNSMQLNIRTAQLSNTLLKFTDLSSSIINSETGFLKFQSIRQGINNVGIYQINFTPIKNIEFKNKTFVYNNLSLFSEKKDSLNYLIKNKLKLGDTIIFVYEINSDSYYFKDTIYKFYGNSTLIVNELGNNISNWETIKWGIKEGKYITNNPNGVNNSTSYIQYKNEIDLTKSKLAVLNFNAKWNIKSNFVQIQLSEDNKTSWKPICGNYTSKNYFTENNPVYLGSTSEFINEQIDLKNYIGKKIYIRFAVFSRSTNTNSDEFYFYNLKINTLNLTKVCYDTITIKSCDNYSWNNTMYYKSGVYSYEIKDNIDSDCSTLIKVLNLTINNSFIKNDTINSCESYNWFDSTYTKSGIYSNIKKTQFNCDSTFNLFLTIYPKFEKQLTIKSDTIFNSSRNATFRWLDCNSNEQVFTSDTLNYFIPFKSGNYKSIINNSFCIDTTQCISFKTSGINTYESFNSFTISPNPFNQLATMTLELKEKSKVKIDLINTVGLKTQIFEENVLTEGKHNFTITTNTLNLFNGIYFVNYTINNISYTQKLLLIDY